MALKEKLIDRFIKYTKIDTRSENDRDTTPSTQGQLELARIVADDLRDAGADEVELDEHGFIFATIDENIPASHPAKGKAPVVGFMAHLDTSPDSSGAGVKARLIENYQGGEIEYPKNPSVNLNTTNCPALKKVIGHTIITTDGTTLLGGDDKAALAVIVDLVHHFKAHPEELHGKIRIGIIPDEEIGVGTEKMDLKKFGADVAYTIDGGGMGEIDVESFNGFRGKIEVEGYVAFPGYGKGTYLAATQVISKYISKMEDSKWPQNCDGRQPIWWIDTIEGSVGKAKCDVYLRGFDLSDIEMLKGRLEDIKKEVAKEFPKAKISVDIKETYRNYKLELDKDPRVVRFAQEAMERVGIKPEPKYVRGGNDSCHLCFSGLLSTNLFIGMQNMHCVNEWNTVETIEGALKAAISVSKVWFEKGLK